MENHDIAIKNLDLSWEGSEILRFLIQESTKIGGEIKHKESIVQKNAKDCTIIATIILSIASNALYDLIKYIWAKFSTQEKKIPRIIFVIQGEEVNITEIINK